MRPAPGESSSRVLDFAQPSKHNTRMTPRQRQALKARWHEIERELADLFDGKVTVDTDPATCEAELLEEQDAIEFELQSGELDCGLDS
jgi:hypothetical protein